MMFVSTELKFNPDFKNFMYSAFHLDVPFFRRVGFRFLCIVPMHLRSHLSLLQSIFLDRVFFQTIKKKIFWRDIQISIGLKSKGRLSYINIPL